ncbi:MAG: hypothetical protein AB7G51_01590 [Steroidobacteraceae bacterium]
MDTRGQLYWRLVWPRNTRIFAVVGAAMGLLPDIVSYLVERVTPFWPLIGFAMLAVLFGLLCFGRGAKVPLPTEAAVVDEVAACVPCDVFRFGASSALAFAVVLVAGQGSTATEKVGVRLGLIEQKLGVIADQVDTMSGQVEEFVQIAQPQAIVKQPRNAAEHFSNAWVHLNIRRDQAAAWNSLQAMYAGDAPRKIDAADLYFSVGKNFVARTALVEQMRRLAAERGDATLLVIAGRHAMEAAQADGLYEAARQLDPGLPFAYWDMQRPDLEPARMVVGEGARQAQAAPLRRKLEAIERFRGLAARRPMSAYFFLPQYQPDYEQVAMQMATTYRSSLSMLEADYSKIIREEMARRQGNAR